MARILIGNIKGPKGDTGAQGPQGATGPQGPQGPLPPLVNNALATEAGVAALDAAMGKTLQDQITDNKNDIAELNSNTTATKTDFTLSGVASGSLKFAKQGKLAQIAFSGVKLTDQLDSGNSIQIFTVAESYRPEATYYVPGLFDGSKDLILAINSNGQITVQNYSGSPVSTASQIYGILSYTTK